MVLETPQTSDNSITSGEGNNNAGLRTEVMVIIIQINNGKYHDTKQARKSGNSVANKIMLIKILITPCWFVQ